MSPHAGPRISGRRAGLVADQGGAILFIALFAALSLCGGLWMLIGVGDAIMTHQRGQEAADAAALSSATVHARAMNATGALNYTQLALTGSYLSFAVVADISIVAAAYSTNVSFGTEDTNAVGDRAIEVYKTLLEFEQEMGTSFSTLDQTQRGLAMAAPALGTLAGQEVALGHKYTAVTLGWSNVPGTSIPHPDEIRAYAAAPSAPHPPLETPKRCRAPGDICKLGNKLFPVLKSPPAWTPGPNDGRSLGLPYAAEPASTSCVRVGELVFRDIGAAIGALELGKGADSILHTLEATHTRLPITVHCSDDVNRNTLGPALGVARAKDLWTVPGPKRMTAANGAKAMRVLAWVATPEPDVIDDSVRRVKLAGYDLTGSTDRSTPVYDAQAEFFYGCSSAWRNAACNDGEIATTGVGYEHALYWMNWRARLTRSNAPESIFGQALGAMLDVGGRVASQAKVPPLAWQHMANHIRSQGSPKIVSLH